MREGATKPQAEEQRLRDGLGWVNLPLAFIGNKFHVSAGNAEGTDLFRLGGAGGGRGFKKTSRWKGDETKKVNSSPGRRRGKT